MSDFVTIAHVGEIPEGRGKAFTVGEHEIAVFLADGQYFALDDYCPHMGSSLGCGDVREGAVICDRHLWAFRLTDGVCLDIPRLRATTFEVRVQGDEIQVRIPHDPQRGLP